MKGFRAWDLQKKALGLKARKHLILPGPKKIVVQVFQGPQSRICMGIWSFPKIGGPKNRSPNTIILTIGTPKKGTPNFGKPPYIGTSRTWSRLRFMGL